MPGITSCQPTGFEEHSAESKPSEASGSESSMLRNHAEFNRTVRSLNDLTNFFSELGLILFKLANYSDKSYPSNY